jgi:G3E family GTPase
MEAIISVVGFLGAGKTTLLKHLMTNYISNGWNPFIILNDYENAALDAQQFLEENEPQFVKALSGSCICCSGLNELRVFINDIPERPNGITLIEANGTTDACSLLSFLGVGLKKRFLPPIQLSVVDVKNWQKRGIHNELEAHQVQASSLIVLTHANSISEERMKQVTNELKRLNPLAKVTRLEALDSTLIPELSPTKNEINSFDHLKSHWSSCSTDLPRLAHSNTIHAICKAIPEHILRIKGCTQIAHAKKYTYFERTPSGQVFIKPFNGIPTTGSKLIAIGPGSDPKLIERIINDNLAVQD